MFKRIEIAHLPTKIELLPRLTEFLDGPELLIKRDDQTGLVLGGNKTRKLEYLIQDAISQGADMVLTAGAAQSNHCRQTAGAAARCGLGCRLVLVGPKPEKATSNLLLDKLLGAEIVWTDQENRDLMLDVSFQEAKDDGKKPYLIPYGGSNAIGAYAYLKAFEEMQEQLTGEMPDWIVFASSSGGTQAGLWLGGLISKSESRILGISVDESEDKIRSNIYSIAEDLNDQGRLGLDLKKQDIYVNDRYIGGGYGVMNAKDREAIELFARHEGILLDPVYTGRAGAGLVDLIRSSYFKKSERVLFWHTGGIPGLFAEKYQKEI
jgi:D-cysteine desulfhydrase family pyridoxal phosphate-dependent enzyme